MKGLLKLPLSLTEPASGKMMDCLCRTVPAPHLTKKINKKPQELDTWASLALKRGYTFAKLTLLSFSPYRNPAHSHANIACMCCVSYSLALFTSPPHASPPFMPPCFSSDILSPSIDRKCDVSSLISNLLINASHTRCTCMAAANICFVLCHQNNRVKEPKKKKISSKVVMPAIFWIIIMKTSVLLVCFKVTCSIMTARRHILPLLSAMVVGELTR